jgi:hypothetical protein
VLNIADQFHTNNNCGFNLANFKLKFIRDFFAEVVTDYERSFVGAFATSLIEQYLQDSPYELYFTVAKFENNLGFTLIQTNEMDDEENEENRADNE